MTDKEQIMIDGVDVSECRFHQIEANELYPKAHYCGSIENTFCENNSNCDFKQLARKTQECEQLKEDYAELEQECERLKKYGAILLADKNAMEIGRDDYIQRCKQLEQECEELKDKIKKLRKNLALEIETNDRYRKALEEIEEVLKDEICEECPGKGGCKGSCKEDKCLYIINEAKEEE